MTTLTQSRPLSNRPETALSRLVATWRKWADARATRAALYQLSERELSDIGLSRGDIDHVTAWR